MPAGKYLDPEEVIRAQRMEERKQKARRRNRLKTTALLLGGNFLLGAMVQKGLVHPLCGGCLMALYSARLGHNLGTLGRKDEG